MANLTPFTGVLGNRLAAHLLRRTTFGPTKTQILAFATKTPAEALADLLVFTPITTKPIDPAINTPNTTWVDTLPDPDNGSDNNQRRGLILAWMLDNFRTDNTLRSKMLFFLHQNFMVNDEAWTSHDLYDHLKLLEYYSLGSYKILAKKICTCNRMLVYLNGYQNYADNSNENYAREFLELFTIGKGPQAGVGNYTTYTEDDIKQAAKLFSGYQYTVSNTQLDPDTNIRRCNINPAGWSHSALNKTFSASFQNTIITGTNTAAGMLTEIDTFVNLIFNQSDTALNICRKLYRYFVHRNITANVETDIITPLAATLKANNYNLNIVLNQLLQSQHFYDLDDADATDNKIGGMLKSPLDLIMHTLRFFNIAPQNMPNATPYTIWLEFYQNSLLYSFCDNADMRIFNTTTVAGYPAYYLAPKYDRNWFDASSITQRYYLGRCLLENKRLPYSSWAMFGANIDIVTWVRNNVTTPNNGNTIIDEMVNYLLPELPTTTRRTYFLNQTLLGTLSLINWSNEWNTYVNSGFTNLTVVKPRLELLFKAILFSQEYQLQ